jgi:carbon storage regulator
MLILSRRLGEKIVVPECGLSVAVVGIQGNRVRLGISAPPEVAVLREEISHSIEPEGTGNLPLDGDPWSAMVADVSDAAYRIALRQRPAGSWMNLQIEVSRAVNKAVRQWQQKLAPPKATSRKLAKPAKPRVPR